PAPLSPASRGNSESVVFFPSPLPSKLCAAPSPHCSHRPPHPTGATAPLSRSEVHARFLLCLKHAPAPFVPLLPLFKPRASNTEPPRPFSASKLESNTVLHHSLIHATTSSSGHPQTRFASPPSLSDTLPSPPPS